MEENNSTTPEENISQEKGAWTEKFRENPWIISTFVLGLLILVLLVGNFGITGGTITGSIISEQDAGEAAVNFVKTQTQGQGELVEVKEFNDDFYEVTILFQGQKIPLYVTKDGEYFTSALTPLGDEEIPSPNQQESQEIPKSDKPEVELFIMTHCPYGTQAEKGFIPMMKEMENLIDAKIRFVHYFMHDPEEAETSRQVCIREEQSSKYLDYLECFLEDGDSERCLTQAKIDKSKLEECISSGKSDEYYGEDSGLSEEYGVQGSPSIVINGVMASSGRSPSAYLSTVCSAFNEMPEECESLELSSTNPSPMWGWDDAGADTQAQC